MFNLHILLGCEGVFLLLSLFVYFVFDSDISQVTHVQYDDWQWNDMNVILQVLKPN